jgi:cobalt-zinc-cadmium efflux system outer membrane protein
VTLQRHPWSRATPLLAACVLATPAGAAAGQSRAGITLAQAVTMARAANPDAILARLRVDSAHGEARIARALPGVAAATIPQVPYQYSLSLPLDLGPQRYFRTRAASQGTRAAVSDSADIARQVTFAARQLFYDVLLAETQRDIAREQQGIFRQLLAADSARLRYGDAPSRDVVKSEIELARADAALTRADASVHAARLALQLVLGTARPDTAFAISGALELAGTDLTADSVAAIVARAASARPDLRAARERTAQSEALYHGAQVDVLPVPVTSLVYQNAPFSNGSNYALGLGFQLPLLYWYGGERERARAGLQSAEANERRTRAQVDNDVQTAIDAYFAARVLAHRYAGGLMARAQTALETQRYAYQSGAASLLELIDAIRTYADVRSDYAQSLHDYWIGVFGIERASGVEVSP